MALNDNTGAEAMPSALPVASRQDGEYPRPQMMRANWTDLDGTWSFRHGEAGDHALHRAGFSGGSEILVPFPPESVASGIAAPGFHPVVWYARTITEAELRLAGLSESSSRIMLHFGAVDYRATVWIDGELIGVHEGGHTPFSFDVTDSVASTPSSEHTLVVRAEDEPLDTTQPRGKQDWREEPHTIWYNRTTGIWQTVWLEAVPGVSIASLRWINRDHATVGLRVALDGTVASAGRVRVRLRWEDRNEELGEFDATVLPGDRAVDLVMPISRQLNGQREFELHWSPEHPHLVDAVVTLLDAAGTPLDAVSSYLGIRTVGVGGGTFLLNGHPYDVRSVLEQGYWPESHLAAPSRAALREEVELIRDLGFVAARIHQKIEDPRFLYWADRLGLLIWGEAPAAYTFSPLAVRRLMTEWMDAVERDASHPSVVTWVPANESWGIQHVADDPAQRAYSRALADVTRALDPTRPVITNDGWEHQNSDIITVHDYEGDGERLAATYRDDAARTRLLAGIGPAGRRIFVGEASDSGQPVMLTEFGGVNYQPGVIRDDGWGYTSAVDEADWLDRLRRLYDGVRASEFLAGSCYTQLTDTMQETNGLCTADRRPKASIESIRAAITGQDAGKRRPTD